SWPTSTHASSPSSDATGSPAGEAAVNTKIVHRPPVDLTEMTSSARSTGPVMVRPVSSRTSRIQVVNGSSPGCSFPPMPFHIPALGGRRRWMSRTRLSRRRKHSVRSEIRTTPHPYPSPTGEGSMVGPPRALTCLPRADCVDRLPEFAHKLLQAGDLVTRLLQQRHQRAA